MGKPRCHGDAVEADPLHEPRRAFQWAQAYCREAGNDEQLMGARDGLDSTPEPAKRADSPEEHERLVDGLAGLGIGLADDETSKAP